MLTSARYANDSASPATFTSRSARVPATPSAAAAPAVREAARDPAATGTAASGRTLLDVLERIGCGHVVIDDRTHAVVANAAARRILEREVDAAPGGLGDARLYGALQQLLRRAKTRLPAESFSWVATSANDDIALALSQVAHATGDGTSIVILLDLDAHPEPNPAHLQHLFGLTLAETRLALQMARGNTPSEVARTRQLSRTTVRSQLASVFAKTQTRRQSELVALLGRIAVLP